MTIDDWLKKSEENLKQSYVATARLDSLILLEDATGKDRAWLLAHPTHRIQGPTLEKYDPTHNLILSKLSQAFEDFESVRIQSSLGMIPAGIYCPEPVEIALDVFTINSLSYEIH